MDEALRLRFEAQMCKIVTAGEECAATLQYLGGARFECLGPNRHQWNLVVIDGEPSLVPPLAVDLPPEE
jgi:hypothetical protein